MISLGRLCRRHVKSLPAWREAEVSGSSISPAAVTHHLVLPRLARSGWTVRDEAAELSTAQVPEISGILMAERSRLDSEIRRVHSAVEAGLEQAVELGVYIREEELVDEVLGLMSAFDCPAGPIDDAEILAAVSSELINRAHARRIRGGRRDRVDTQRLNRSLEWLASDRARALGLLERNPAAVVEYRAAAQAGGMVDLEVLLGRLVRVAP